MKIVNECCSECGSQQSDKETHNCPVCNNEGTSVKKVTVEHLVKCANHKKVIGEGYKICMNEDCNVVYYNVDNGIKLFKEHVRVPIWFKKDADPKYACYCSKVTKEQVIDAVINHDAKTVKEVNEITGAMKNANCKENNPLGVCCHKIIQEAIDEGLKIK